MDEIPTSANLAIETEDPTPWWTKTLQALRSGPPAPYVGTMMAGTKIAVKWLEVGGEMDILSHFPKKIDV